MTCVDSCFATNYGTGQEMGCQHGLWHLKLSPLIAGYILRKEITRDNKCYII